jgi:hypothetical protein
MGVSLPSQEQICAQVAPDDHPRPLIGEKNPFIRVGECLLKLGKVNIRMERSFTNSRLAKSAAGVALISALLLPAIFESSSAIAAPKAAAQTAAKKAPVKKAPVKKAPVKKAPVKKAPVKKAPVKKVATKKAAVAKKAPVKKAAAKKVVATKKAKAVPAEVPAVVAPAVAPIDPTTTNGVVAGVKAAKVARAVKTPKTKAPAAVKPRGLRRLKMLLP